MIVDFQIGCPDMVIAKAIASGVSIEGFNVSICQDSDDGGVTCECGREMLLAHSELLRIQCRLTDIAHPFGGMCEAWGTFGNSKDATPAD